MALIVSLSLKFISICFIFVKIIDVHVFCQQIDGNFTYCNINDEKKVVNLAFDCSTKPIRAPRNGLYDIIVLHRVQHVLDGNGWECYKTRVTRYVIYIISYICIINKIL